MEQAAYFTGLAIALVATFALRQRFRFLPLDWDYGIYGYQAQWFLKNGENPLEGNIDKRFLIRRGRYGYNLIFLLIVWLCGNDPRKIRLFDTLTYLLTETVIFIVAFKVFGGAAAVAAAFLFGVFSSMPFTWTADANSEKYTILFDTLSLLMIIMWLDGGNPAFLVFAGIAGFCSTATKQNNLLFYAAIFGWLLFVARDSGAALLLAAVFALLYGVVLGYYRLRGVPWMHLLGVFFVQPTQKGVHYLSNTEVNNGRWVKRKHSLTVAKRFWHNFVPHISECGPIWILAAVGIVWAALSHSTASTWLLVAAFVGALLGFLAPNKFFPYYYIPFIPILSLFAGGAAAAFLAKFVHEAVSAVSDPTVVLTLAASAFSLRTALPKGRRFFFCMSPIEQAKYMYKNSLPNFLSSQEIADYLRSQTSPEDHILVYSINPEIYFLSGRRASIEHVYLDSVVLGLMTDEEQAEWQRRMARQMRENKPKLIVMMNDAMTIKEFEKIIRVRYELVKVFDSKIQPVPDQKYRVYRLREDSGAIGDAGTKKHATSDASSREKHASALALHRQGKDDEALSLLREVLSLDPQNRPALRDLANFLLNKGRFEEAIPHLEKLVEAEPYEPQNIVSLACAYQKIGNHQKAVEHFERTVAAGGLNPSDRAALYRRLGDSRLATQQYGHAAQAFANAVSLDGNSPQAHIGLGLCMAQARRTEDARLMFEKAISLNPDCADAYNNLGALAWTEARVEDALGFFKRTLEIKPDHRDALPNYLSITFALELYEQAESLLRHYVKADPDNPALSYQLAYCHFKLGRQQQAQTLLQKVVAANPDHADARSLLAQCEAA